MTNKFLLIIAYLFSSLSLFSQIYITNVTIADVENQQLIPNQTIVITNDLISKIQSSKSLKIPNKATLIDGTGKYAVPGLTDAHIHFFQNGGLYTRPDVLDLREHQSYEEEIKYAHQNMENTLYRYLQNGITNVIDVGATYSLLDRRKEFKTKLKTPSIQMTGPLLTTYLPAPYKDLEEHAPFSLVQTTEEGIKMVQEQLQYHPDFIKVWYIVEADGADIETSARKHLPMIKAIIEEAHKNNLNVAVHATERITAQLAVENGCDFLVHSIDNEILKEDFIQLLKKNKTILCPTLRVRSGYLNTLGQKIDISKHELQKADPYQLGSLLDLKHLQGNPLIDQYKTRLNLKEVTEVLMKVETTKMANLKLLSDAGVLLATGTDAGNIGTLHASSYLAELQAMKKGGLSNWKILEASTINGAKILNKEHEFGSINVGKKANFILLDANPIDDIENLTKINTVINRGSVFKPNEILEDNPEDLAQRQLNAYNFRNIDAFLAPYAEDVEVYSFPDKLLYKGKETMRKQYTSLFENTPTLHCELKERIVQGNIIIDKEKVQFGEKTMEATAIYHIENGKIKKVYFID